MSNQQNIEIEEMKEEMRSDNNMEDEYDINRVKRPSPMDTLIKQMDESPVANSIRIYNSTGIF